jgi:hypothetical protein
MIVGGGASRTDGHPLRGWLSWDPGGPLAWIDALLQARDERLEADRDDARRRMQAAEAGGRAAARRCQAAEAEVETLKLELERVQTALVAAEAARRRAERRAERALDEMSRQVAGARADLTWDLVRRLQADLAACRSNQDAGVSGAT